MLLHAHPYNMWIGAIQMWPMQQSAIGHGILGPRPGPRAHAYVASHHAGPSGPYGAAMYGAPTGHYNVAPHDAAAYGYMQWKRSRRGQFSHIL
jgi:hypothetical protein